MLTFGEVSEFLLFFFNKCKKPLKLAQNLPFLAVKRILFTNLYFSQSFNKQTNI